jgi:hypothetical protein
VERMVMLWCFLKKKKINIGWIIEEEIKKCALNNKSLLFYPCLITKLCKRNDVPNLNTDKIVTNNGKVEKYVIRRMMHNDMDASAPTSTRVVGSCSSQPEELIFSKEYEEFKEVSQKLWRFMKGCGDSWKQTCFHMASMKSSLIL